MQTTQRVIVYLIILVLCLAMYKYGNKLLKPALPSTNLPTIEGPLESQNSANNGPNILSDDYDNISLDFSINNISKKNITESNESDRFKSLYGETN